MELVNMTCRNCGGKLSISKGVEQILCQHCGTEFLVFFGENSVSLKKLEVGIQAIHSQLEINNAELALNRLKNEEDDIWKKAWPLYKILQVGHQHADLPDFEQKAPYTTNPNILLLHLKKELELQSKKILKDKNYLAELSNAINSCARLVERLNQIEIETAKLLNITGAA